MISLFIDTSTHKLIIAIYKNNQQLYLNKEETSNDLSSKVLPTLKEALNKVKISIRDIDNIYIANGPGSFTGIRVGVTIAKVLAYSLQKKVFPVSELMALATTPTDKKYIVPCIDARRGYVYGAIYDDNQNVLWKDSYIKLEDLKEKVNQYCSLEEVCFVSYDSIENSIEPSIQIEKIMNQKIEEVSPHYLNPNYLKKTEAEENLR